MPELPEIEVIVQGLGEKVEGLTISKISVNFPNIIKNRNPSGIKKLQGEKIRKIYRRGKFILADFSGGGMILTHLGMTGRLLVMPTDQEIPKHSHIVIDLKENCQRLVYNDSRRFGKIIYSLNGEGRIEDELASLGDDPTAITFENFYSKLSNHKRMIKPLLLDQSILSGLGNIYTDESLFSAGIHPRYLSHEIPEDKALALYDSIKAILRAAIEAGGSTINSYKREDGSPGYFQFEHKVYGKTGRPCPVCGTIIERIMAGGRSSSICINCQKPPAARQTARMYAECWWGQ